GRLLRSIQELLPIDDLHDAVGAGTESKVHAVAFRPSGYRTVEIGRRRSLRTRLLARQPEVSNESRRRRIAQVIDRRHARRPPARLARDQIGDAGLAFP